MTDIASVGEPKRKRKQFGRHGKPHRLPGLDFRTSTGRAYSRHFRRLVAAYPFADVDRLKRLATTLLEVDRLQVDCICEGFWERARARELLISSTRIATKEEDRLRAERDALAEAAKPAGPDKPALPDAIAAIALRHKAAAE